MISRLSRELGEALLARELAGRHGGNPVPAAGFAPTAITDTAGSSAWFDRGFVTTTNEAKQQMLGVSIDSLLRHGAVKRTRGAGDDQGLPGSLRCGYLRGHQRYRGPGGGSARRNRSALSGLPGRIVPVVTNPCSCVFRQLNSHFRPT